MGGSRLLGVGSGVAWDGLKWLKEGTQLRRAGEGGESGRCSRGALVLKVFLFSGENRPDPPLERLQAKVRCSASGPPAPATALGPSAPAVTSSGTHDPAIAARRRHGQGYRARVQDGRHLLGAAVALGWSWARRRQNWTVQQIPFTSAPLPRPYFSSATPVGITWGSGHAHQAMAAARCWGAARSFAAPDGMCHVVEDTHIVNYIITKTNTTYTTSSITSASPSPSGAAGVLGAARRAPAAPRPSARPRHRCTPFGRRPWMVRLTMSPPGQWLKRAWWASTCAT